MYRRRSALIATALAALALALGACGEKEEPLPAQTGDDPATTTTAPTTQPLAAWIGTADGLCSEAMAEQEETRREVGGRQVTLADRARLLVDLAPSRERLAGALAALPDPERQRAAARRLVATAERRAQASTEAGRLYSQDGPRAAIAEAAAAEHDERELFVEIATGIGMTDCAEILSTADRRAVAATVEQGLGSPEPARRCAAFGERFLAELYGGGEKACLAAGADGSPTGSVTVDGTEGIDGVFALAVAEVDGVRTYRVRLTYEDGAYKIDKLD